MVPEICWLVACSSLSGVIFIVPEIGWLSMFNMKWLLFRIAKISPVFASFDWNNVLGLVILLRSSTRCLDVWSYPLRQYVHQWLLNNQTEPNAIWSFNSKCSISLISDLISWSNDVPLKMELRLWRCFLQLGSHDADAHFLLRLPSLCHPVLPIGKKTVCVSPLFTSFDLNICYWTSDSSAFLKN